MTKHKPFSQPRKHILVIIYKGIKLSAAIRYPMANIPISVYLILLVPLPLFVTQRTVIYK